MKRLSALLLTLGLLFSPAAEAAQGSLCIPTSGTLSGLALVADINSALAALVSSSSGTSAPINDCSAASVKGQVWLNTNVTPNLWEIYDGVSWETIGSFDGTNHIWTPPVGGGTGTIASAATTDIGTIPQSYVAITGNTNITSFGSSATPGTLHFLKFATSLTISYNGTTLILPTASNIVTAGGDTALALYLGSSNWIVIAYQRADGTALSSGLSSVANNSVISNISGGSATPIGNTLTAIIDSAIGSTRGSILERGASAWSLLAPGALGQLLKSNGAGADVGYGNVNLNIAIQNLGTGTVTPVASGELWFGIITGGGGGGGGGGRIAGTGTATDAGGNGGNAETRFFAVFTAAPLSCVLGSGGGGGAGATATSGAGSTGGNGASGSASSISGVVLAAPGLGGAGGQGGATDNQGADGGTSGAGSGGALAPSRDAANASYWGTGGSRSSAQGGTGGAPQTRTGAGAGGGGPGNGNFAGGAGNTGASGVIIMFRIWLS